jgi:hypothetical protein
LAVPLLPTVAFVTPYHTIVGPVCPVAVVLTADAAAVTALAFAFGARLLTNG